MFDGESYRLPVSPSCFAFKDMAMNKDKFEEFEEFAYKTVQVGDNAQAVTPLGPAVAVPL
jgi:hypothetical protein